MAAMNRKKKAMSRRENNAKQKKAHRNGRKRERKTSGEQDRSQRGNAIDAPDDRERQEFADMVMERWKAKDAEFDGTYNVEKFSITGNRTPCTLNLHNLHADYRRAFEEAKEELLNTSLDFFCNPPEMPKSFPDAADKLYPVIINRWIEDIQSLEISEVDERDVTRPLTDNLAVALVCDYPTATVFVTQQSLSDWNVDENIAFCSAMANLQKLFQQRVMRGQRTSLSDFAAERGVAEEDVVAALHPFEGALNRPVPQSEDVESFMVGLTWEDMGFGKTAQVDGLYVSVGDDWYSGARILIPEWIRMLPVDGDHVVMVTKQDFLFVTGSENEEGLRVMAEAIRDGGSVSHPVSNIPIRLTDDGWETYLPPSDHPTHEIFKVLHHREMGGIYARQQEALWSIDSAFVSSYTAVKYQGMENCESYAVWTRGIEQILPRTDYIAFMSFDREKERVTTDAPPVPWADVQEIVGHLTEETDYSPPRYRTRSFPSDEELQRLNAAEERAGMSFPEQPNAKGEEGGSDETESAA